MQISWLSADMNLTDVMRTLKASISALVQSSARVLFVFPAELLTQVSGVATVFSQARAGVCVFLFCLSFGPTHVCMLLIVQFLTGGSFNWLFTPKERMDIATQWSARHEPVQGTTLPSPTQSSRAVIRASPRRGMFFCIEAF